MTSFISKNNLFLKCDGCEKVVKIYENQTDHTLIHDYIRENNWKTHKIKGKWKHFCPECEEFYLQKKREENFKELNKMTNLTEQEIWKSMSEFDNEYEVSNLGRFRSVDRVIIRKGSQVRIKGRIIKGQQDAYGYVTMTIKKKQVKAHRLVAKYFVENPLNKNQVNHKNGIKNDNRAVNLEWCSHEENMKHLYLTMPFEHKNSKQKRMEREDLIRKLTQFVESKTIEDVKNSWVSAKNILDVLSVKYNKINIPMFYDEWQAKLEENARLKERVSKFEKMQYSYTPEEWNTMLRTVKRTKEQNAQLKEQINHLLKTQARQFVDNQKLQVKAEKAKDVVNIDTARQIKQLKELLKECLAHLTIGKYGTSVTPINILCDEVEEALK